MAAQCPALKLSGNRKNYIFLFGGGGGRWREGRATGVYAVHIYVKTKPSNQIKSSNKIFIVVIFPSILKKGIVQGPVLVFGFCRYSFFMSYSVVIPVFPAVELKK
jgi:hypothetical protein